MGGRAPNPYNLPVAMAGMSKERRMRWARNGILFLTLAAAVSGCQNPPLPLPPPLATRPATRPLTLPAEDPIISRLIGTAQKTVRLGADEAEVLHVLGTPAYQEPGQWTYVADDPLGHASATIRFTAGKVTGVKSTWSPGWQSLLDAAKKIASGASPDTVVQELGDPAEKSAGTWWTYYPEDLTPTRADLFFENDKLSWGSFVLLARLKKLPADLPTEISTKDIRRWLGEPAATEPGAVWNYTASGGAVRVKASVYFRGNAVVKVHGTSEPTGR
jgi:hypothetical protein